MSYGVCTDSSESEKGWEEYRYKTNTYRRAYSQSTFTKYTDKDGDADSIKVHLQYTFSHLKNVKISSTSTANYTIVGKPNYKNSNYKK